MIVYEITSTVKSELIERYEKYMTNQHIPDLIETGYFLDVEIAQAVEGRYRIRYRAVDQATLDQYFSIDAERLRNDFIVHFPCGVEVVRENWNVLKRWPAS